MKEFVRFLQGLTSTCVYPQLLAILIIIKQPSHDRFVVRMRPLVEGEDPSVFLHDHKHDAQPQQDRLCGQGSHNQHGSKRKRGSLGQDFYLQFLSLRSKYKWQRLRRKSLRVTRWALFTSRQVHSPNKSAPRAGGITKGYARPITVVENVIAERKNLPQIYAKYLG